MIGSVFGPVVNAVVALGLFGVMLLVLRSRRPHLGGRGRAAKAAPDAVEALREQDARVCGDPATGR